MLIEIMRKRTLWKSNIYRVIGATIQLLSGVLLLWVTFHPNIFFDDTKSDLMHGYMLTLVLATASMIWLTGRSIWRAGGALSLRVGHFSDLMLMLEAAGDQLPQDEFFEAIKALRRSSLDDLLKGDLKDVEVLKTLGRR